MIAAAACRLDSSSIPPRRFAQAVVDPLLRRVLMGLAMGATVDRARLLADGRAVRRAPQPGDDADVLSARTRARCRRRRLRCRRSSPAASAESSSQRCSCRRGSRRQPSTTSRPLPGPWGTRAALGAEIGITFVLMTVVLHVSNHRALVALHRLCAGVLVCVYITVEAPVSGMSLNPARSLGPALLTREFDSLWIYSAGPLTGMLLAAEAFVRGRGPDACPLRQAPSPHRRPLHLPLSLRSTPVMTPTNHYDVIIIGSGAGGGTLAYRLAPSGKRILILERGGYVPREKDNWSPRAVNVEAKYHTKEVWHTPDRHPLHPHTNYYVGGNTKFYGAALFRLRREDFGELRHDGGLSPAWPIGYDDLEPYYTEAERIYQRARRARRRSHGAGAPARRIPSGDQPRAAHPAAARRSRACGTSPVPCAARGDARRAQSAGQPLHPLRHLRRLPLPRAREVGRGSVLRRAGARAIRTSRC